MEYIHQDDAREKWCPFARVEINWIDDVGTITGNRFDTDKSNNLPAGTKCLAEECMAWIINEDGTESPKGRCGLINHTKAE